MQRSFVLWCAVVALAAFAAAHDSSAQLDKDGAHIDAMFKLTKLKDLGLLSDNEFESRKNVLLQEYLGSLPFMAIDCRFETFFVQLLDWTCFVFAIVDTGDVSDD